jgi:hypothetical protein
MDRGLGRGGGERGCSGGPVQEGWVNEGHIGGPCGGGPPVNLLHALLVK